MTFHAEDCLDRVAELFVRSEGQWIDGVRICAPDLGGMEGIRRKRDLELIYGWTIEKRRKKNSRMYQYRLISTNT